MKVIINDECKLGWAPAQLGDIIELKYGKALPDRLRTGSGFPVYGSNGVVGHHEESQTTGETIVVGRKGSVGAVQFCEGPCSPIDTTYFIDQLHGLPAKYWFHFLRSLQLVDLNKATAVPGLNREDAYRLEILVPPPAEQKRIADKLETVLGRVDACRARLARVPDLLKRFRQSVLAAATSGQLTEDWRTQHSDENAIGLIKTAAVSRHHLYKDHSPRSDLPLHEIPDSWAWASLRFILSPDEAFCYGVVQPGENDPNGSLLIRAGDLVGGRVDFSELRRIPRDVHKEYHRSQLKGGEVLVTVVGAGIGTTAIAQPECAGCNIARAVAKLPIRDFNARFVHCWLSTSRALSWLKHESREVARPTLNLEQLQKLPVPIPPLSEQAEIVRRVEALFAMADRIAVRLSAARAQVERLTPATLHKAFRGDLVPQDPNDEPASKLLKRIHDETLRKQ